MFLMTMSLIFYAWGEPSFALVMIASIFFNYFSAVLIHISKSDNMRKFFLILCIAGNLSILFYYKYLNFAASNLSKMGISLQVQEIALPIGISFYTFQIMSYVIDFYRGETKLQRSPFKLALYVALFPQLIAGPIVRYVDVEEQIETREHSIEKFALGVRRFVIGLAKKVIIANHVALVADNIFNLPAHENTMATAWLGIICYTFQIYFDFSGYSDMAIGLGKMLGFDFLENFDYPYISKSATEFWRRWHLSLSTWFRDYVYIPLGGNRKGNVYFNLFVVFLLTGLWHGASWNFVAWGLWHGAFLIIERLLRNKGVTFKVPEFGKWLYTMSIVVLGWIMFRAEDLAYAVNYLGVMCGVVKPYHLGYTVQWYLTSKIALVLFIALLASLPWKKYKEKYLNMVENSTIALVVDRIMIIGLFTISIILIMTSTYNPFIYFRF